MGIKKKYRKIMKINYQKYNKPSLNLIFGLIIILSSCQNNQKRQVILDKNIDIKIICDSIDLSSEVSFFGIFFHIVNYSDNDVFISFNNEDDTLSRKSLVFITSKSDTIPIWYPQIDLGIKKFEKRSITFFMGMIERKTFNSYYHKYGKNIGSLNYFNNQLALSKIIYVPDQTKFTKNFYHTIDTLISIKGIMDVDMKNTSIIYRGDTGDGGDSIDFRTKKL